MLSGRVVTDAGALADAAPAWDALAVAAGRPYCAPAWMLAWWRHLAPEHARLRVVLVHDGDVLAGVLPLHLVSEHDRVPVLRLLTAGFTARIEPLAQPGREAEVAQAAAAALAPLGPGAIVFEGLPDGSAWPALLAAGWPGRAARRHEDFTMAIPLSMPGSRGAAEWMKGRSRNFRKESGRVLRRIADAGGSIRRADGADAAAVEDALRMYRARWLGRGGGERTGEAASAMLREAGAELAGDGRFDVWLLEAGGVTVGAEIFVRAGAESAAWGGGFVPEWARFAPSVTLMLEAIRHGADEGVERVDLGEGEQPYKQRFTDTVEQLRWTTVFPRGRHSVRARAQALPKHARWWARDRAKRLPPGFQERLRALRDRRG